MGGTIPVRFEPGGVTVWAQRGCTVLEAARDAGVVLDAPCAGRGVCGGCAVRVLSGSLDAPDEEELAGLRRAPTGVRLACRAAIVGPATLQPVVAHAARGVPAASTVGAVEREPVASPRLVAAVDLGTSTVASVVIERDSRREIGRGVVANRQAAWGADVLSRVSAACSGAAVALRQAAEASVIEALVAACADEGACLKSIGRLVVVGNSAMTGILLGADVTGLTAHPFTPAFFATTPLPEESAIRAQLAVGAQTRVLPPLAGFVGSDILAGLMAEGLDARGSALFMDLGTNAEVVEATDGRLVVASAAAGPAFEGGGISAGGPAVEGAVQSVAFDSESGFSLDVIGGGEPRWLCGSGLVSTIALLRRLGHLDEDGRLTPQGPLAERMVVSDGVVTFMLGGRERGDATTPKGEGEWSCVQVDQRDVRAFQLAKAAVRTAIETVWGRRPRGTDGRGQDAVWREAVIAGAFGSALSVRDLVEVGVLPSDLRHRVRVAGNTALLGAAMVAVDSTLEQEVALVPARVEHVQLALEQDFTSRYLSALALAPYSLAGARA